MSTPHHSGDHMVITPLRKQTTPTTRIMPATNTTQMPTPTARRCPTVTRAPS